MFQKEYFRKERKGKLVTAIDDKIRDEKLQYDLYRYTA